MRNPIVIGGLIIAAQFLGIAGAFAGPWEDGMVAYNRGDYMPAIRLFRPLAEAGNTRAQHLIGVMYHRGQGVAKNPVRALAWFSVAARRGAGRPSASAAPAGAANHARQSAPDR
jgi:TPR repeat protein